MYEVFKYVIAGYKCYRIIYYLEAKNTVGGFVYFLCSLFKSTVVLFIRHINFAFLLYFEVVNGKLFIFIAYCISNTSHEISKLLCSI